MSASFKIARNISYAGSRTRWINQVPKCVYPKFIRHAISHCQHSHTFSVSLKLETRHATFRLFYCRYLGSWCERSHFIRLRGKKISREADARTWKLNFNSSVAHTTSAFTVDVIYWVRTCFSNNTFTCKVYWTLKRCLRSRMIGLRNVHTEIN